MADLGIRIKTTFDNKGVQAAKKAFGTATKKGQETASKIKTSFSGMGDAISGQLAGLAAGVGIGVIVAGLSSVAVGSFKAAEEAKVATSAFTNLSGSANIARINLQAMERATRGLISETEQMQIANQLLGMRIVETDEQLEQVVGVSRRLGKEFKGLGAREAAEEFAIMIANMSVARLDSFGLSSGKVRERIEELMRTTEGMNREQAFFQATMEEAENTLQRLGPEVSTSADEIARLGSEWKNFQIFLGQTVEETGVVKNFFKTLTDDLIVFRDLLGDDTPEARIKSLNVQLEQEGERLAMLEGRGKSFFGIFAGPLGAEGAREHIAELKFELQSLLEVQEMQSQQGAKEQAARQAAIASEEKVAANIAERAKQQAKLAAVQEQFAKDVIDIQSETQDQLSASQEQFDDNSLKAAEDHTKRIAELRKRAAKSEEKQAKRLQKDITKIDSNLKKSLVKQQVDESKKIAKAQSDFAKDDKAQRRQRQIDAAGDERLFQFELRNLAADGQGIAIKQALERRAIEQQIASEKAEFEKSVEQEKRKDTIDSMRQEGQEARAQLQQQATERKADLELRNQEAKEERELRLQEELAAEAESFAQKKADLNDALTERNEKIRESEQERVAEIAKGLAETEELTLAQFDKMIALAEEFGPQFGQTFADGMTEAFSEALDIEKKIEDAGIADIGAGAGGLPVATGSNGISQSASVGGIQPFQTGAVIERSGVGFLHVGEEIANPNIGQSITINSETFAVRAASQMAAAINAAMQQNAQMIVDTVAANL
jgi:hypothetical protein